MDSSKEAAKFIPLLEAKLASNGGSPSFARLAFYHLKEGHHQKAIDVCTNGLRHFPNYATAHLVLGQCYETMGRSIEAMLEFRRALKCLPDNRALQAMVERCEHREQEAFRAFSVERSRKLKEGKETVTFEKYTEEGIDQKESTAEFLLKRLQNVKRGVPLTTAPGGTPEETPPQGPAPNKIVTATLAEIYAAQGEYKEAIGAYQKLAIQRPIEAERYAKRIAQLEELSRIQESEHTK